MSTQINTISDREEIRHFSHEHPLIYTENENPRSLCNACGVAFLSSPCYSCSKDCNFFLHQPCVRLIRSSERRFGDYRYSLKLLANPPHADCICEKCKKLCTMFTYECSPFSYWYGETFYLHCQCAFFLEINIEHISHSEHSLVALCKEPSLLCDACGGEQKGIFFSCSECSFHIHQDCCLVPSIAKIDQHPHLLSLIYSLSKFRLRNKKCLMCEDLVSLSFGAYVCLLCRRAAHLNCSRPVLEEPAIGEGSLLPGNPNTFPSSIIRGRLIEGKEDSHEIKDGESKIDKYHCNDHSSWNQEMRGTDIQDQLAVCNACIQPITDSLHYNCPQSQCDFLLHQICAKLTPTIRDYFGDRPLDLFSESKLFFCSMFWCWTCGKICNGFGYKDSDDRMFIDIECASAPTAVKHMSHNPHLLVLSIPFEAECVCCGDSCSFTPSYICVLCDYYIHVHCAFLPKTVKHKFDEHPLDLIYDPTIQIPPKQDEEKEPYLCEFCEEDVNPEFWFYYCGKCDQSFHIDCIPSTGKLSKIKFGRNIDLPRDVHHHPVALTRMLTMGSQSCGDCKRVIQGFTDDMAFHCSMCDFWIHFQCAERFDDS